VSDFSNTARISGLISKPVTLSTNMLEDFTLDLEGQKVQKSESQGLRDNLGTKDENAIEIKDKDVLK